MAEIAQTANLIIPESRVPVGAYQAIYHKLTRKTEKLTQIFDDIYEIKIDDIIQLNNYLEQTIIQYGVKGKSCECTLSLNKHESFQCSSFEKFKIINFNHSKPTAEIDYQLDFFTVIPTEIENTDEIVQKFKVTVRVDQDFYEDNDHLPLFMRNAISGRNIVLTIEYSDFAVARNLQGAVQDWVATLSQRKESKSLKFLDDRSDFINVMLPRILATTALIGGAAGWSSRHLTDRPVSYILYYMAYALIGFIAGHIISVEFFRNLNLVRPKTFLLFTKGDRDRHRLYEKQVGKKKAMAYFVVTIFGAGIVINLLSSFIGAKLGF